MKGIAANESSTKNDRQKMTEEEETRQRRKESPFNMKGRRGNNAEGKGIACREESLARRGKLRFKKVRISLTFLIQESKRKFRLHRNDKPRPTPNKNWKFGLPISRHQRCWFRFDIWCFGMTLEFSN